MRIVAGTLRGRTLTTPADRRIRPTSDRVREAIFNILAHGIDGFEIAGVRVLDLFAGTGALGLEAISRGAAWCLFVEEDADARGLIRDNIEAFGLTGVTRIFRRDATDLGEAGARQGRHDLLLMDPPYRKLLAEKALPSAAAGGWLEPGAVAVVEEAADVEVTFPAGYTVLDRRVWGDTSVTFARFGAPRHTSA